MAVFVALGAFLMTLAGGWTAQRVTDRRHLVLSLAGGLMLGVVGLDLLPEAPAGGGHRGLRRPGRAPAVRGRLSPRPIWWNACSRPAAPPTAPKSTSEEPPRWA